MLPTWIYDVSPVTYHGWPRPWTGPHSWPPTSYTGRPSGFNGQIATSSWLVATSQFAGLRGCHTKFHWHMCGHQATSAHLSTFHRHSTNCRGGTGCSPLHPHLVRVQAAPAYSNNHCHRLYSRVLCSFNRKRVHYPP
jgi:hypothetical protein